MDVEARLSKIETRQEALISVLHSLADVMEQTRDMVAEVAAWLQQPSSSEVPDLLRELTGAVVEQGKKINTMSGILVKLPEQLAQTVSSR